MGRLIRVGRRLVGLKAASRRPLQTTHDGTPEGVPLQSPSPLSSSVAYDGSVQKPRFYAGLKACSTLRVRRSLLILILALTQITSLPAMAQEDSDTESWFSLTSSKTFLSGEKPEIAVNAHNVKQLEFRVYRVNDPVKFFGQMQELHNFGGQGPALPKQSRTWLEKFHAWKHRLWVWVRDFVREQFSPDSRHAIRLWQMGGGEPGKGPKVANYAQVPVLNPQQVVSVWQWTVPLA